MSRSSLAAIAFAVLAGCSSHAETVCQDALAALDACLAAATAGTSCVALASAETACGGGGTDGGPTPDAGPVAACTASRDCLASCYLRAVANTCAPSLQELETSQACGATCPP